MTAMIPTTQTAIIMMVATTAEAEECGMSKELIPADAEVIRSVAERFHGEWTDDYRRLRELALWLDEMPMSPADLYLFARMMGKHHGMGGDVARAMSLAKHLGQVVPSPDAIDPEWVEPER